MMRPRTRWLLKAALPMGVALLVAALVFPLAYLFDNKYTHAGPQAIGGVLYLGEEDVAEGRVHYLVRDWEYYPGVLLSPADLAGPEAPSPEKYVYIGQFSGLNMGNPGGHAYGQGTYRLNILLPEEQRSYTLLMPEVYCAGRLYVNGELLLSLGNPTQDSYQDQVAVRPVTFDAGGRVEILLATGSRGHLYNGLTHPPAFGPSGAVLAANNIRIIVRGGVVALGLLLGLMFLYIRVAAGYKRGAVFALQCLCMLQYAGQPLFRVWVTKSMQPWNTFYLLGYYGTFWVVLILQASLCGLPRRHMRWVIAPGAAMCLAVLALPFVLRATPAAAGWFSVLSDLYKWAVVAAMLAAGLYAVFKGLRLSSTQLGTATFFALSLAFDRILPLYEPIYSGWFGEIAGMVVTASMAFALWKDVVQAMRSAAVYNEALRRAEGNLEMQRRHYRMLDQQVAATRALHHDFRQQLVTLAGLADSGDLPGLRGYLAELQRGAPDAVPIQFAEHHAVNVLTRYYAAVCRDEGVAFTANWQIPADLGIPDPDISVVLGNLLENAAEAAARAKNGWVKVDGRASALKLVLVVSNSYQGPLRPRGDSFASTKAQGGGQGLASVAATAQRAGGTAAFIAQPDNNTGGGVFTARVILPLEPTPPANQ